MSSITEKFIPIFVSDDCETQPLNCAGEISAESGAGDLEVIFPTFLNGSLPMAGGSIVRLDLSSWSLSTDKESQSLISEELNDLSELLLSNDLESLSNFRTEMNKALFRLREFNVLDSATSIAGTGTSIKSPKIYLSYLQGDDSTLDETKSSSLINKVCKFKHIPFEAFNIALSKVISETTSDNDFGNTIGVSGRTFRELYEDSKVPKEDDIIALMLELFTIFNISEDDIIKNRGAASDGGYYTIFNKKVYIKMPDISGRDSAGFYSDIFNSDSNFYIEASKSRKSYARKKFDSVSLPILATVDEADVLLEDSGFVEIIIDTASKDSDIKGAYLSILTVGEKVESSNKTMKFNSESLELFSIPMLTVNDYFEGKNGTITYDLSAKQNDINFYIKVAESAISIGNATESSTDTGIPFIGGDFAGEYFFGEKNRPEMVLANHTSPKSINKNDRRYFSPKAYGVIPLLSQIRPRLYKNIPSKWIKMDKVQTDSGDDKLKISFAVSKFDDINFDTLGNKASFSLYLDNGSGQIFKAAGENITVSKGTPKIKSISPDGYKGSNEILSDSINASFKITGENLTAAIGINIKIKDAALGADFLFSDEFLSYSGNSTAATLTVNSQLSYIGLEPGQEYEISLIGLTGEKSNFVYIYINTARGEELRTKTKVPTKFKTDEFKVRRFNSGYISEIPILTDANAVLKIKSKQKVFDEGADIFAYICVTSESIARAIGGDDVIKVNAYGETFYVPFNLEYEFSSSSNADFGRQLIDSRANLLIPGNKYKDVNLFPLLNASIGSAILFYNKRIIESASGGELAPIDGDFSVTFLGDLDGRKPFILGPTILGLIADIPGAAEYTSTFIVNENESEIRESFSEKAFNSGEISVFEKINKLGIIFSSSQSSNLSRQLNFYIGSKKISGLSEKIKDIGNGRFMAVFSNVAIKEDGVLDVRIEKKDKVFDYTSAGILSKRASFMMDANKFTYDPDEGTLSINSDISTFLSDGIIEPDKNPIDLLIAGPNSGILFDQKTSTEVIHRFIHPLSISSNVVSEIVEDKTKTISNVSTEITQLYRTSLVVKSSSFLTGSSFFINETGAAIGYLNWNLSKAATIKSNVPEITLIKPSLEAVNWIKVSEINGSNIKAGTEIKITVRNTKKNFKVIFNGLYTAKTKGPPRKIERGVYEAIVKVPALVAGVECIELCVSTKNSLRINAKKSIGEKFTRNIGQNMADKLSGFMKDKIPDISGLKKLIEDFPLRFLNVKLDKSLVPLNLINSFCDFSWHLTADLKLALNGFQTLLIPIQVILCIIDVICSLLNPIKLARAVIRLFYCLYDLLLLLPQISVPVMFLHLVLHLLQLLECVVIKVIEIVTSINEIIKAIEIASQQNLWDAIITLEEMLSEYLFELNVDLDVLEPIISIFAIFLEILQLIFSFPCPPDDGIGDKSCGIQGSMLAGIVAGKVSPGEGVYDTSVLIPFAQYFTDDSIEDMITSNSGSSYNEFSLGDKIIDRGIYETYYEAMNIDSGSLRTTNGDEFEASFSASFTKSTKGLGEPTLVKFKFKDKLNNSGFFKKKILDPLLNRDAPIHLLEDTGGALIVASDKGNFISPIDGESFINKDGNFGTVKQLTLTFEIPIMQPNPDTGILEEIGTDLITRTFDDIPKMAIMDEEANLYFIEPNGIEFNNDNSIEEIKARMISNISAPKFRFTRDDQDIDTDDDGLPDDEGRVYDLPQLFFVDMRAVSDELQSACYAASYNEFLLEEEETGDTDDIADIVKGAAGCVEEYRTIIYDMIARIREDIENGRIPEQMDLDAIAKAHQSLIDCLNISANNICRFVVNPLNTSFLIEEDKDNTPLEGFPDVFDPVEFGTTQLEQDGPTFTGAREYAGGIGDSYVLPVNSIATIRLTPRDSYDLEMPGDLRDKITFNIISDTTGNAKILDYDNGETILKEGPNYYIRMSSNTDGEVKLSATICNRTVAAVTYAGIVSAEDPDNCVPSAPSAVVDSTVTRPGALMKVDRILSLYFIKSSANSIIVQNAENKATTSPQLSGTALEN